MPLSFAHEVKTEIADNKPMRARHKKAQAYGLLLFGRSFSREAVSLRTEHLPTAKLYASFLREFTNRQADVRFGERTRGDRSVYTVDLAGSGDREILLRNFGQASGINEENLQNTENFQAFIAGAFLACGNITDPQKSYHMEYVVPDDLLCTQLCSLLGEGLHPPKRTVRRGSHVVYYKESAQIEDIMTAMGASKSCLSYIEVEIVKTVRNKANRVTNCETANIDKTVSAAAAQMEDIQLVLAHYPVDELPVQLREAAHIRLQNPDMSLRELAEIMPGSISRSGMHHRLDRLSKMAENIRDTRKGADKNV